MYFLAIFPAVVWIGASMFRRRLVGVLIVLGGLAAALGATSVVAMVAPIGVAQGPTMFHLLCYAYIAVVTAVGMMIVCQTRRNLGSTCYRCAYDLRGNESGICPECGALVESDGERVMAGPAGDGVI